MDNNLKIDFPNPKHKATLEDSRQVTKLYGPQTARKLGSRFDDLDATHSMGDMRSLPGHWEELNGGRSGQFSARLHGSYRLIVKPQKHPPPVKADGGLDWSAIDSIYIVDVVDHHD